MNNMTFALPSGYDWDTKVFARKVKTKAWAKQHQAHLSKYVDRLTTAGNDHAKTVKTLLESAYGVNIGGQVFDRLKAGDVEKIRWNLINLLPN